MADKYLRSEFLFPIMKVDFYQAKEPKCGED